MQASRSILVFLWWEKGGREEGMEDSTRKINSGQPRMALGATGAKVSPQQRASEGF